MPSQEHEAIVEMIQAAPPGQGTLEESRAGYEQMLSAFPLPADAVVESIRIEHMKADWVSMPVSRENKVVLYLHGGGYVIGSNVGYREFASRVAAACRARVLVVDYRLAPENPFPAAVDDATMAYRWLLALGFKSADIAIAGDSAGGGLTLATLVALRDGSDPLPGCAVCFSPWVDLEGTGGSAKPGAVDDPMVGLDGLKEMAAHYAPNDLRNPLAAPLHADLAGLPPLKVFVGTREILLDDAKRIVDQARAAGVDVELEVGDGLVHVWPVFPGLPESVQTLSQMGDFTAQHL